MSETTKTVESTDSTTKFCRDCGEQIQEAAEICPNCGIRQEGVSTAVTERLTDQYSVAVWAVSVVAAALSFPIGLVVPGYLYLKASNGTGIEQSGWETWTAVLLGVIGIAAVELGGKRAAKLLWGVVGALFGLGILAGIAVLVGV
ncbi:MAG: hypothetical protein A07HR60_01503 [uncultured archaeon A07HR60]|nr:MAG: hypothetical protein A07HR60_01503 [uncultured archaeon A07HR60]